MSTGRLGAGDSAIQSTIFDAKADLLTATAADTPARLAVGSNGDTLVADSAATTGLRWQGDFAAGKNAIINGDFRINQRAFSSITASDYTFDRWRCGIAGDGTTTVTAQTFTLGAAPVAGYEGTNFIQIATTGQTSTAVSSNTQQKIESVRTLAGQTVTVSFWAKATSGTPKIAVDCIQNFGATGSPSSQVETYVGQVTLSTSWTRYSLTVNVPSISGKTITTSDYLQFTFWTSAGSNWNTRTGSLGIQTATIGIWGVQVEAGSVATAFQTATGTLAGELAACQRYFQLITGGGDANGSFFSANKAILSVSFPVTMRVAPTATYNTTYTNAVDEIGVAMRTPTSYGTAYSSTQGLSFEAAGMTSATAQNGAVYIGGNHQLSAEL